VNDKDTGPVDNKPEHKTPFFLKRVEHHGDDQRKKKARDDIGRAEVEMEIIKNKVIKEIHKDITNIV
jgi:hypothetical protein